jgi:hypothetical protein
MAAIGIALKPIVSQLVHLISTPLGIPGGSLAGGLYMMWIVLAAAITGKLGTATLVGIVQAIMIILTAAPGSHGALSLLSYTMPGVMVDLVFLLLFKVLRRDFDKIAAFAGGIISNLTGTMIVNVIYFSLPPVYLILTVLVSILSGGIGGMIVWGLYLVLKKYRLIRKREGK